MVRLVLKSVAYTVLILIIAFYAYVSVRHVETLIYGPRAESERLPLTSSISDGTLRIHHTQEFTLAGFPEELPTQTTHAPCADDFFYCLYYGGPLGGAALDSAGFGLFKSEKSVSAAACLDGYSKKDMKEYSAGRTDSVVSHASSTRVLVERYRIHTQETCYTLESKISIHQSPMPTEAEEAEIAVIQKALQRMAKNISLRDGTTVVFPK